MFTYLLLGMLTGAILAPLYYNAKMKKELEQERDEMYRALKVLLVELREATKDETKTR